MLEELRQLLGSRCDCEPAELTDERGLHSAKPLCVVYPKTVTELSRIMALANDRLVPVVPLGGNTGLCAGAVPLPEGKCVALSLSKMRQIQSCDPINYSVTAEAGLTVAEVAQEAELRGMYFPLRFGADATAQIGGAVSTNAGGSGVLRYGNTRDLVLGLEVVLADGRILSQLGALRKDNTGYDLKQLFIGSEGTLGICSAVTFKLFAPVPHRQVALVEVASVHQAVEFFKLARQEVGELLLACEWMSSQAVEISAGKGTPLSQGQSGGSDGENDLVLVELASGIAEDPTLRLEKLLAQALRDGLVLDAKLAASQSDADKIWSLRELIPQGEKRWGGLNERSGSASGGSASSGSAGHGSASDGSAGGGSASGGSASSGSASQSWGSVKHDVAVEISVLSEFIESASQAVKAVDPEAVLCLYGHLGDGNIHFNLLPSLPSVEHRAALSEAVYNTVAQYGGSFSAEHGVGLLHTDTLSRYKDPVALELMKQLKQILDPNNILNPGKVIEL